MGGPVKVVKKGILKMGTEFSIELMYKGLFKIFRRIPLIYKMKWSEDQVNDNTTGSVIEKIRIDT